VLPSAWLLANDFEHMGNVNSMERIAKDNSGNSRLVPWTQEEALAFGQRLVLARHRLHELALFSNAALLDLLESYPRERLQAFTMGADPANREEWRPVDTTGASATDLLAAVTSGRLWFNVLQVHLVDRRYRDLVEKLYGELTEHCPHFRPHQTFCTLLISSPTSLVYYHADAQPNLLWHIRGTKRVFIYPAGDKTLIDQELMEDIFASFADEEVPYQIEFDQKALSYDLHPGDVLSWPQNAPHRVTNLRGLNVSLSTVHETDESDRRKLVYCANRLFRRSYRLPFWSTKETGVASYLKRLSYRAFRRAGLVHAPRRRVYLSKLRIDPSSPTGFSSLPDGPVLTEYSKKDFRLDKDASGNISVVETSGAVQGGVLRGRSPRDSVLADG